MVEQDLKANDRCDVGGSSGILRKKTCCIKNAAKFLHFCKRYQPFCLRNICVCEIFEKGMKAHVLHGTAIFTFIYLHEKLTFPVNLRRKRCVFFWHFFSRLQKKGDVFEPFKVDPFGIHVFVLAYKQRTCFRCVVFQDFDLPILMWTLFWAGAWSIEKKMQHIKLSNMDCVVIFAFCFFLVPRKARQDISGLTGTCSTATWFAPMMPKFGWMDFGGI